MQNDTGKSKLIVLAGCVGIVIMFFILIGYETLSKKPNKVELPSVPLASVEDSYSFELDKEKFPFFYQFNDLPYAIGVPAKGLAKVEGGYAYQSTFGGIIIAETSSKRTPMAYSTDMYSYIYSLPDSQPTLTELTSEQGYINSFAATYCAYKIELNNSEKTSLYELAYFLDFGEENIVVIGTLEDKDIESKENPKTLNELATFLKSIIHTLYEVTTDTVGDSEQGSEEEQAENISKISEESVLREAVITAEQSYENLYLTFAYMDINLKPEECFVTTSDGTRYDAAETSPGAISFLIPDVAEGDSIKITVKSTNLNGTTVEQQEYADYLAEKNSSIDGNLHVEEEYIEDYQSEQEESIIYD